MLRSHSNNVVDVAWSADSAILASASLDNTIIIWSVETGKRTQVLEGHAGFVKG